MYGFHCRFCIKVSNQFRRNDKLSTKGYGCKDGEPLPEFWRGCRFRPNSQKWMNRGGPERAMRV